MQTIKNLRERAHDKFIGALYIGALLWLIAFYDIYFYVISYMIYAVILALLAANLARREIVYNSALKEFRSNNGSEW